MYKVMTSLNLFLFKITIAYNDVIIGTVKKAWGTALHPRTMQVAPTMSVCIPKFARSSGQLSTLQNTTSASRGWSGCTLSTAASGPKCTAFYWVSQSSMQRNALLLWARTHSQHAVTSPISDCKRVSSTLCTRTCCHRHPLRVWHDNEGHDNRTVGSKQRGIAGGPYS